MARQARSREAAWNGSSSDALAPFLRCSSTLFLQAAWDASPALRGARTPVTQTPATDSMSVICVYVACVHACIRRLSKELQESCYSTRGSQGAGGPRSRHPAGCSSPGQATSGQIGPHVFIVIVVCSCVCVCVCVCTGLVILHVLFVWADHSFMSDASKEQHLILATGECKHRRLVASLPQRQPRIGTGTSIRKRISKTTPPPIPRQPPHTPARSLSPRDYSSDDRVTVSKDMVARQSTSVGPLARTLRQQISATRSQAIGGDARLNRSQGAFLIATDVRTCV